MSVCKLVYELWVVRREIPLLGILFNKSHIDDNKLKVNKKKNRRENEQKKKEEAKQNNDRTSKIFKSDDDRRNKEINK